MEKLLSKLINNQQKYQVFLLASPVTFPLSFAVHAWFVINIEGKVNRWEFGRFRGSPYRNKIGVLKNFLKPTEGMNLYFWKQNPRFNPKLLGFIEGDKSSLAHKMASFIDNHSKNYPLNYQYSLKGPNSNTYVQWILNKFPESNLELPSNAFGKNFNIIQ